MRRFKGNREISEQMTKPGPNISSFAQKRSGEEPGSVCFRHEAWTQRVRVEGAALLPYNRRIPANTGGRKHEPHCPGLPPFTVSFFMRFSALNEPAVRNAVRSLIIYRKMKNFLRMFVRSMLDKDRMRSNRERHPLDPPFSMIPDIPLIHSIPLNIRQSEYLIYR